MSQDPVSVVDSKPVEPTETPAIADPVDQVPAKTEDTPVLVRLISSFYLVFLLTLFQTETAAGADEAAAVPQDTATEEPKDEAKPVRVFFSRSLVLFPTSFFSPRLRLRRGPRALVS